MVREFYNHIVYQTYQKLSTQFRTFREHHSIVAISQQFVQTMKWDRMCKQQYELVHVCENVSSPIVHTVKYQLFGHTQNLGESTFSSTIP